MNVVIHTVFGQIYLHIAAFICGIFLFFVYLFGKNIGWVAIAARSPRFDKFKPFFQRLKHSTPNKAVSFVNDLNICVLAVFLLLSATFILNSGNFRLLTVATLVLGFCIGKVLLAFVSEAIIIAVIYVVKFTWDIVSFPLAWLIGKFKRVVQRLYAMLLKLYRQRRIKSYTEHCIKSADEYAKYGFTDNFYKELIK